MWGLPQAIAFVRLLRSSVTRGGRRQNGLFRARRSRGRGARISTVQDRKQERRTGGDAAERGRWPRGLVTQRGVGPRRRNALRRGNGRSEGPAASARPGQLGSRDGEGCARGADADAVGHGTVRLVRRSLVLNRGSGVVPAMVVLTTCRPSYVLVGRRAVLGWGVHADAEGRPLRLQQDGDPEDREDPAHGRRV
jgi:hypothetical protein